MSKNPKASEKKDARTLEIINQEYTNLCAELGHLSVRYKGMARELNRKIRALSLEADDMQKASVE